MALCKQHSSTPARKLTAKVRFDDCKQLLTHWQHEERRPKIGAVFDNTSERKFSVALRGKRYQVLVQFATWC